MTPEQILLYACGELSAEERRAVETVLAESDEARRELARIMETLGAFESLPAEDVTNRRWASMLRQATAAAPARRWPRLAAAALLVLSAAGALAYGIAQKKEADRLRSELAVAVALLQESGSADRLRGVGLAAPQLPRDAGARAALARAMRSDPSPNVRLAVVDALWGSRHGALNAELLAALPLEPLPAVRLEMIAVAAQMDDTQSRPVLESLVRSDPDPAVRARARDALTSRGARDDR